MDEFDISIHLGVNPSGLHGSNCVYREACGYVLASTGIEPVTKPGAFAASFSADHYAHRDPVS